MTQGDWLKRRPIDVLYEELHKKFAPKVPPTTKVVQPEPVEQKVAGYETYLEYLKRLLDSLVEQGYPEDMARWLLQNELNIIYNSTRAMTAAERNILEAISTSSLTPEQTEMLKTGKVPIAPEDIPTSRYPMYDQVQSFIKGNLPNPARVKETYDKAVKQYTADYNQQMRQWLSKSGIDVPVDFGEKTWTGYYDENGKGIMRESTPDDIYKAAQESYDQFYKLQPDEKGNLTSVMQTAINQRQQKNLVEQAQTEAERGHAIEQQGMTAFYQKQQADLKAADALRTNLTLKPLPDISGLITGAPAAAQQPGGVNQNLERFVSGQGTTSALEEYNAKFPGAREAWWQALGEWAVPSGGWKQQQGYGGGSAGPENYGAPGAAGGVSLPTAGLPAARDITRGVAQVIGQQRGTTPEAGWGLQGDPLSLWLKNYPWYEKFMALPAAQRGFNQGRLAP